MQNVFSHDNSLSIWILKLAMVRNDLYHINNRLLDTVQSFDAAESFYFFRISISHYREAIKIIDGYKNDVRINEFIKSTSEDVQKTYEELIAMCSNFEDKNSEIQALLKPIRDNTFHYHELSQSSKANDQFIDSVKTLGNLYTRIKISGAKRNQIDFVFADEVKFHSIYGVEFDEDEFRINIHRISLLIKAFIGFSDSVVALYLGDRMSSMMKITIK